MMKRLNFKSLMIALTAVVTLSFFTACEEEETVTDNVWEVIQNDAQLSSLAAELEAAGLATTLAETQDITLFAPSNSAMTQLLLTLGLNDFSTVRDDVVQAVLTYHVLASVEMASAMVEGAEFTTLQGEKITVASGPTLSSGASSNSGFDKTNIKATNGVVHRIDVVMVPPTIGAQILATLGTIAQPLSLGKDFTTLKAAVDKADEFAVAAEQPTLTSLLLDADKYTVFAPVNSVFEQAQITLDTYTGQQWYGIIAHHVVPGEWTTFVALESKTSALGQTLTVLTTDAPTNPAGGITSGVAIDSDGDQTANGQIAVENAAVAANGVIHAFAGVLAPPQ